MQDHIKLYTLDPFLKLSEFLHSEGSLMSLVLKLGASQAHGLILGKYARIMICSVYAE